jgi:regulatory protein
MAAEATERAADPAARLQHALDLALRFLNRRDRTEAEVRRHLAAKRVEPATIDQTVACLQEDHALDDARYALRFAQDRRDLDGWGAERIERKLLSAGVAPDAIAAALASFGGADSERDAALSVLRSRIRTPPATDRERERALGLLIRRGYDIDLAYEAVRAFARDAA